MINGILGRKIGMTQVFEADGTVVPVTVVEAGPCLVVQRKTKDNDGYDALQLGLVGRVSPRRLTAPAKGHFEKAGVPPTKTLGEVRCDADE
ncbi:MAG: large ribosomal subunit protein uL3, partial [Thermoanaerobaculia bacterium]